VGGQNLNQWALHPGICTGNAGTSSDSAVQADMLEKAPELNPGLARELNRLCRSGATSDLHRLFRSPSGGPYPRLGQADIGRIGYP
jgi:hypothetical protein